MTPQQTQEVKNKIIEAVPEIRYKVCPVCEQRAGLSGYCKCGAFLKEKEITRPIQLADVLRAIGIIKDSSWVIDAIGRIYNQFPSESLHCDWDLSKDFDGQSDETKEFLYNILTK